MSAYILRPSFAGARLRYQAETGQIQYRIHKGLTRSMDALNWIALVTSHIPDPHQQVVRNLWEHSPRAPRPPRLLPHKLEALLAALPPRQAQQVRASVDSVFWDDVPVYRG